MNEDLREALRAVRDLTERVRRLETTMAEYRSETQRLQQELADLRQQVQNPMQIPGLW